MFPMLSPVVMKLLILAGGVLVVLSPLHYVSADKEPDPKPIIQQVKHKPISREEYLEFHESRDELQEKHSDY